MEVTVKERKMTVIRMVLTLIPLPRLRLERQMGSGEDCLSEASSAAAPDVALRPKDEAARGVFLFGYFILDKQNKVSRQSRESDLFQTATLPLSLTL
jgi:hypothetical protein